jgi:hypothetical protein
MGILGMTFDELASEAKMSLNESMQWAWAIGCQLRGKTLKAPAETFALYVDENRVDSAVLRGLVVSLWHSTDDRGKNALSFSLPSALINICALSEDVVIGPGPEWTPFLFGRWAALYDDVTLAELTRRLIHRDGSSAAIGAAGMVQNVVTNVLEDSAGSPDPLVQAFYRLVLGPVFSRSLVRRDWRLFPAVAGLPVILEPLRIESSFLGLPTALDGSLAF